MRDICFLLVNTDHVLLRFKYYTTFFIDLCGQYALLLSVLKEYFDIVGNMLFFLVNR